MQVLQKAARYPTMLFNSPETVQRKKAYSPFRYIHETDGMNTTQDGEKLNRAVGQETTTHRLNKCNQRIPRQQKLTEIRQTTRICNGKMQRLLVLVVVGLRDDLASRPAARCPEFCIFAARNREELLEAPLEGLEGRPFRLILLPTVEHEFVERLRTAGWRRHTEAVLHLVENLGVRHSCWKV